MPYDKTTGIITEPLNINKGGDIQQAVNYNSGDLGDCIRNGKVNKWSFHKPVRFNTLGRLTSEQIGSVQCGLIPVTLPRLVQMSIGYTGGGTYTKEQCITQVAEWGYNKPRGRNGGGSGVHEWYRHLDFSSYNAKAIAPDSGWAQMDIEQEDVTKMSSMTVDVESSGSYTGRNFKLTPRYNGAEYGGGLYTAFAMRFGDGSGESIGDITHMDIPIRYVTALTGNWRLALAVWVPNFNSDAGGWGLFISRMTITQYFDENLGSGTNLKYLYPDLATNPLAMYYMNTYISGGYESFTAVPLLIRDVTYRYVTVNDSNLFMPYADSSSLAYCMPSGSLTAVECGTPPIPIYYSISYSTSSGAVQGFITNTDTVASHTFGYRVRVNGAITIPSATATLAAGERRQVAGTTTGNNLSIEVTSQDGTPME